VEINSVAKGIPHLWEGELHILVSASISRTKSSKNTLERQRGFRLARFNRIVDRLRQLGYPVDAQVDEMLAGQGAASGASLGRPADRPLPRRGALRFEASTTP